MRVSPLVDVNANPEYCPEQSDSEHAVGKVKRWNAREETCTSEE